MEAVNLSINLHNFHFQATAPVGRWLITVVIIILNYIAIKKVVYSQWLQVRFTTCRYISRESSSLRPQATVAKQVRFIHSKYFPRYPVILSIEDNCSLDQQRVMAQIMVEIFDHLLLVLPVDKNETSLPSPHQLRGKILLKHKKLPDGADELPLPSPSTISKDEGG